MVTLNATMVANLQHMPLFETVSPAECAYLSLRFEVRLCRPGEVILTEGSTHHAVAIIGHGLVEVCRRPDDGGTGAFLAVLGTGDFYGEMSLLCGEPASATLIALEATEIWLLKRSDFWDLLITHPQIGLNMCRILAQRLANLNRRIGQRHTNLALCPPDPAVAGWLSRSFIMAHRVLPISFANRILTLAMVEPRNSGAIHAVRHHLQGMAIDPVIITEADFEAYLRQTV